MARDPARRRRRYRSAALARLGWNDIHPCPAKTAVDLFSACNVRSPSVMASYLERNVSDERATSIAPSPLQISQPNGRPGGPRRLVTSRNGDALSMPTSMPASKACTVPRARDGNRECQWRWISNCFTTNPPRSRATLRGTAGPVLGYPKLSFKSGAKKRSGSRRFSADDLYATHFGSLASWAVSRFTVAMRIACNPRTLFSNLFGLFVAVVSRPACSISDTRSRWRWILMLASATWALAIRSRSSRIARSISSTMRPATVAVTSLAWRASIWP